MRCTRCAGLRVSEIIYEGGNRIPALRCVHCGDVVDHVIAFNRQRLSHQKPRRARMHIYRNVRWKKNQHATWPSSSTGQEIDSEGRQPEETAIPAL